MRNPYISVSGVGSFEQRVQLRDELAKNDFNIGEDGNPDVVVGVQATYKTQFLREENKMGKLWHPVGEDIWEVFGRDALKGTEVGSDEEFKAMQRTEGLPDAFMHYSFGQEHRSAGHVYSRIGDKIGTVPKVPHRQTNKYPLAGVQLNGLNFVEEDYSYALRAIRRQSTVLLDGSLNTIIMQVGEAALDSDPQYLSSKLSNLGADFALLDVSGGMGEAFSASRYGGVIEKLKAGSDNAYDIAIAGGLGPGDMGGYKRLVQEYGPLSVDAEGRLRDNFIQPDGSRTYKESRFSVAKATEYILEANDILRSA